MSENGAYYILPLAQEAILIFSLFIRATVSNIQFTNYTRRRKTTNPDILVASNSKCLTFLQKIRLIFCQSPFYFHNWLTNCFLNESLDHFVHKSLMFSLSPNVQFKIPKIRSHCRIWKRWAANIDICMYLYCHFHSVLCHRWSVSKFLDYFLVSYHWHFYLDHVIPATWQRKRGYLPTQHLKV